MQTPSSHVSAVQSIAPSTLATVQTWRQMARQRDFSAAAGLLHPDAVLHSPLSHEGLEGGAQVAGILCMAIGLYSAFSFGEPLWRDGGHQVALPFEGQMGPHTARGVDLLTLDADGRVTAIEVFMRPLAVVSYLAQQVAALQPA